MVYIVLVLYGISAILIVNAFVTLMRKNRVQVDARMHYIKGLELDNASQQEENFGERVILPLFQKVGRGFIRWMPEESIKRKKVRLDRAGFIKDIGYERFVARKFVVEMIMMTLALAGVYYYQIGVFYGVITVAWIWVVLQVIFRYMTGKAITRRQSEMLKALPYALDLITVSVEAGLSLDGAISRIVSHISGALSDELGKTLKEMRMGIEKKIALRNMAYRCDVKEISVLMTALIQADELGISLGKVLRIESAQMREKRRQSARERAMKAPVKILFPLVFFIFPSLFIIILGPAVLQMMTRL